jgi:hypothetical protein
MLVISMKITTVQLWKIKISSLNNDNRLLWIMSRIMTPIMTKIMQDNEKKNCDRNCVNTSS